MLPLIHFDSKLTLEFSSLNHIKLDTALVQHICRIFKGSNKIGKIRNSHGETSMSVCLFDRLPQACL